MYRTLPYTTQAVVNIDGKYPEIRIKTVDDIWDQVEKLCEENKKFSDGNNKFTDGQNLYHQIPLFADPDKLVSSWMWDMINEYNYVKRFNISLGELDNVSAHRLDCFSIIDKEIMACQKFEQSKNG